MEKGLFKYFAVFIYGMTLLIALGNKEKENVSYSTASNGRKTKTYTNSTIKEERTITAQKFFSSNQRFTLRFSENEFSFLY